jgi:AcrR family transcriptional regulator
MAKTRRDTGKPDGNALRTQRTRARILAESQRLFNERGEGNVTTGTIAEALNMSPGNLYYHFRNKDQIVERLFQEFEERIGVDFGTPADAPSAIEDLWLYLHLMLEAIWDFRFLYRNLDDVLARNARLRNHFNRIVDRKADAVESLCAALVRAGAMRATAAQIRALTRNILVVASYWLNFRSIRGHRDGVPADDLGMGAFQVMALVAPYLVGAARAHLDRLGRAYVEP